VTVDEALTFARIEGSHYIGARPDAMKVLADEVIALREKNATQAEGGQAVGERDEKAEWRRLILATARAVQERNKAELAKINAGMPQGGPKWSDYVTDELEEALKPFEAKP